ncbi:MAG: DmsE family decaheme c-type cytochrome [bacterium]
MPRRVLIFLLIFFVFRLVPIAHDSAKGDSGFAGSETCKDCHEVYYNNFIKSVHGKKAIPGSPINKEGCESCHGPGAQHIEKGGGRGVAIFVFNKKESSTTRDSKCLACHENMKGVENWNLSKHKSFLVTCDNCHSIHSAVPGKNYLKAPEPDLCFGCHRNIRTQFNKQSHHPIKEAFVGRQALKCSSCHNPMGTFDIKAMIKADSVNDLCYRCHAEKRGPYAFEHPPVPENCLFCHEVHGSNHSRLLTRKAPLLCESCHDEVGGRHNTDPYTNLHSFSGTATSGKNRFFGRSCLNCHGNIHGSSLSEFFVR